jgi:hypothetical protein
MPAKKYLEAAGGGDRVRMTVVIYVPGGSLIGVFKDARSPVPAGRGASRKLG